MPLAASEVYTRCTGEGNAAPVAGGTAG